MEGENGGFPVLGPLFPAVLGLFAILFKIPGRKCHWPLPLLARAWGSLIKRPTRLPSKGGDSLKQNPNAVISGGGWKLVTRTAIDLI